VTRIDHVITSPLKRALWTVRIDDGQELTYQGQQVQEPNTGNPPLSISPLLREQYFGQGERVSTIFGR
jgi:hypothetical protein